MGNVFDKLKIEHRTELKRCLDRHFEPMDMVICGNMPVSVLFLIDDYFNVDLKAVYVEGIDILKSMSDESVKEIEDQIVKRQFAFAS